MAKGDAYLGLKHYLQKNNEEKIILTFKEIEKIINRKLPQSGVLVV